MTSEIKDLSDQILNEIKQAKNILLHCHVYPDADSICSVLAMAGILKQMGKTVTPIMGDSQYPDYLTSLPHKDWLVEKNYTEI
ncbi:MAG: MgpA protein, partial [Candidatus Collierbacteria bacterium GW2011_GWB1_44_6]